MHNGMYKENDGWFVECRGKNLLSLLVSLLRSLNCDIHHRLYQYCGIPVSMSPRCQQVKKNTYLLHTHVLNLTWVHLYSLKEFLGLEQTIIHVPWCQLEKFIHLHTWGYISCSKRLLGGEQTSYSEALKACLKNADMQRIRRWVMNALEVIEVQQFIRHMFGIKWTCHRDSVNSSLGRSNNKSGKNHRSEIFFFLTIFFNVKSTQLGGSVCKCIST